MRSSYASTQTLPVAIGVPHTPLLGERTPLMGVLNVTPDSFSDGGHFLNAPAAIARALEMERAGADILDIGGESTRPGADPVGVDEEVARVLPVLDGLEGKLGRFRSRWIRAQKAV